MSLRSCVLFFLAAALSGAGTAHAQVTVFSGANSAATSCSLAARHGRVTPETLATCTVAIEHEHLIGRDLAGTYVNRGVLLMRMDRLARAQSDFDAALSIAPTLGEAWVNHGAVLIADRRWADGVADIDHGLALSPQEPEKAYYNRALAKERLDDVKGAYLDYRKAAELSPKWDLPQAELKRFNVTLKPAG